jgi:hypothetical protein
MKKPTVTTGLKCAMDILPNESRKLAVLRHIAQAVPVNNRWHAIFDRYLEQVADRVRGLGGNPDTILPSPTGDPPITQINQIKVHIKTGNKDPNRNTRVYLGFEGKHGREFRIRTTDDANPFRENTALDIIFGSGANVRDKNNNDPTNPPMDKTQITGAYIRIEPRQQEPWKIASAQVFINGSVTPTFSLKLPDIILEDDGGEKVSLG